MVEKLVPTLRFLEFNENWEEKSLGEILSRRKEKHKISKDTPLLAFAAGQGVIDRSERKTNNRDFLTKDSKNKTYLLTEYNDIVYNPSNLKYGAIDRNSHGKGVISPIYVTFVSNVSPLFMEYIVKSYNFKQKALKYEEGTVIKRQSVHPKDLVKIKIKIPKTESERIKIGTFLSSIDKKMELLEKKHDKFQNFKKYLMQQIFTQKLRFNFTDEWKIVKLESLIKKGKAGGTPSSTNSDYYNGDIPFLSIRDMTEQGKYILKTEKTITEEGLNNSSAWIIPKNSLLYSIYASIGLVAINRSDISTSQAIYGIILKEGVSLEYMYYYLTYFKKNIHKYIETGTQGNLNAKLLKSFEILLPSLEEQEMIVNVLSIVDEKIENSKKEIEKINEFKKGLLQQMFI